MSGIIFYLKYKENKISKKKTTKYIEATKAFDGNLIETFSNGNIQNWSNKRCFNNTFECVYMCVRVREIMGNVRRHIFYTFISPNSYSLHKHTQFPCPFCAPTHLGHQTLSYKTFIPNVENCGKQYGLFYRLIL